MTDIRQQETITVIRQQQARTDIRQQETITVIGQQQAMPDIRLQETITVIIRQLQAMTVIRLQEAGHHQTAGSNVIWQHEAMSSDGRKGWPLPESRKTETVQMLAVIGMQLTHIHKQITSHKSDFPLCAQAGKTAILH